MSNDNKRMERQVKSDTTQGAVKNAQTANLAATQALYYQRPELPQPSVALRVPYSEFSKYINMPGSSSYGTRLPVHFYSALTALTIGGDATARASAIIGAYNLIRGARSEFSDFRPIDFGNYFHACHFVKLVAAYVEETLRMAHPANISYSETTIAYQALQTLGAQYSGITDYTDDVNLNLDRVAKQYARFRAWALESCFCIDSYNARIDQMMHAGFLDEALTVDEVPAVIFRPVISAYLEASHTYDPNTGKYTSFNGGEISTFPTAKKATTVASPWCQRRENESWLNYLNRIMTTIPVMWGNTYSTIASYLPAIIGTASNVLCPPEHLDTAWSATFNDAIRAQLRNATPIVERVVYKDNSGYKVTDSMTPESGIDKAAEITKFTYDNILVGSGEFEYRWPAIGTECYVPSRMSPSGYITLGATSGEVLLPTVPITTNYASGVASIEAPSLTHLTNPITVEFDGKECHIRYHIGTEQLVNIAPMTFEQTGEIAQIPTYALLNNCMSIGSGLDYVLYNAFHDSWCGITPCITTLLYDNTHLYAYQAVDYDKLGKISTENLTTSKSTEVTSFWVPWYTKPNAADASAIMRSKYTSATSKNRNKSDSVKRGKRRGSRPSSTK